MAHLELSLCLKSQRLSKSCGKADVENLIGLVLWSGADSGWLLVELLMGLG